MQFDAREYYDRYAVTIKIRHRIYGGTPKSPEVIEAWIRARTGYDDALTKAQTAEALETQVEQEAEKMWTGFPGDERGLFIWTRQVKAMLRESATMLGITKRKRGTKQVIQHGFELKGTEHEQRIYLGVDKATGAEEGPIHVITAQGPRTALKRQDYIEAPTIKFEVWVLSVPVGEDRRIGEKEVVAMLTFAQENGLGASRSQGHGKFDVVEFAKIGGGKLPIAGKAK